MARNEVLLDVQHIKKYFPVKRNLFGRSSQQVKAVDDVGFKLYRGEQ
ncbi:hypothetical protein ACTID9_25270 [Brevibacillus fluminis]